MLQYENLISTFLPFPRSKMTINEIVIIRTFILYITYNVPEAGY